MPGPLITNFYKAFIQTIQKNNLIKLDKFIGDFKKIPNKIFDFNDQDMFGKTLAHYLIEYLNVNLKAMDAAYALQVLDKFLTLGIDLNIKDINGKTAIDVCSKAPSHSSLLQKLNLYRQTSNFIVQKKPLFDRMAEETSSVIVGSIDDKYSRIFLVNYPNIYECHCTTYISREPSDDCRGLFEAETLKYLSVLPGENEITVIGSGHLLDTLILIAKFKKNNPNASLRVNLIDHCYAPMSGGKPKELFEDFVRCMRENNIKMTVAANETGVTIPNVDIATPGLDLTISIQNDFSKYLALKRRPKVLVGADLDCGKYNHEQHKIAHDLAKEANALAYVSLSDISVGKNILDLPKLIDEHQKLDAQSIQVAKAKAQSAAIPAAVPFATAAPTPFLNVAAMEMPQPNKPIPESERKTIDDASKANPKTKPHSRGG